MAWGLIGTDSLGEFRQYGDYVGWNGADWRSAALAYLSTEASEAERLEMSAVRKQFTLPSSFDVKKTIEEMAHGIWI